jgi:hypothetical protein
MPLSENLRAIRKPQPLQGFCFDHIIFKLNFIYLKVFLRMKGSYRRFKKLKASKDLTQIVTTNPDFLKY